METDLKEICLNNYAEEIQRVKEIIRDAGTDDSPKFGLKKYKPKNNLYSNVTELMSDSTRNSQDQISYLQTFEKAMAAFRTASLELRKEMDIVTLEQRLEAHYKATDERKTQAPYPAEEEADCLKKRIADAIFFSNRYALFFAGHLGLDMLGENKAEVESLFSFGKDYDTSKDRDTLTAHLAKVATNDLSRIVAEKEGGKAEDEDLKHTLKAIFTSWINQFSWPTWKDVAEENNLKNAKLRLDNYSLLKEDFKARSDLVIVDDKFMDIRKSDVIGEQELGTVIWQNCLKLSAYCPERKNNPHDPASVIFTFGEPGGGKTFNSHAYIQSFADLCRDKGLSLWAITHSTTDYASHYQNKTSNELASLAGKINSFPGVVVMYVADADNIFQSRKDPNLTAEQQQTLAVYFKMFDGTLVPKNGKFMAIMDANYIDGIDDATKSRLFDEIQELKRFDRPDEFAELARRLLTKENDGLKLSNNDWGEIGQYVLDSPLSNRETVHVLRQIRREFTITEDMVGRPYEEHVTYRNKQLEGLTKEQIITKFDHYINTRAEIEKRSQEAKFKDDKKRFLDNLNKTPKSTKS